MKTSVCGACGGKRLTAFGGETFLVGGEVELHNLSGDRCDSCGEVYFDRESGSRYSDAGNALVLARREAEKQLLAKVRKKLKLTQRQAAALTGGGPNAFSRYERGTAHPVVAVVNLFRLLDKHPELLQELR